MLRYDIFSGRLTKVDGVDEKRIVSMLWPVNFLAKTSFLGEDIATLLISRRPVHRAIADVVCSLLS